MKTRLIWKSRVTEVVRKHYPDAQDTGDAIEFTRDKTCREIWLFMLGPFKTIQ